MATDQLNKITTFEFPSVWRHGIGLCKQTGTVVKEVGGTRVLVLSDPILHSLGVTKPVLESLEREAISYHIDTTIDREPTVALFDQLVNSIDLTSFDTIIALGGGSVLDTAKGVAVIASFGGHIRDYDGFDKVPQRPKQTIITIPTTAGTGSEISDGVVLIDEERDTKFLVISKKICPDIALTDPEMTRSMPPSITAQSGTDALVHAVESYISNKSTTVTEAFSLKAINLISSSLRQVYQNGDDIMARERVQTGATMAMVAGMNAYLGICHAMAMPLCALYHMPHGVAVGMLLPVVLDYNIPVAGEKIKSVYRIFNIWDESLSEKVAFFKSKEKLTLWLAEIGITSGLNKYGFKDVDLKIIVEETLKSAQRATSPRQPEPNDLKMIVEKLR